MGEGNKGPEKVNSSSLIGGSRYNSLIGVAEELFEKDSINTDSNVTGSTSMQHASIRERQAKEFVEKNLIVSENNSETKKADNTELHEDLVEFLTNMEIKRGEKEDIDRRKNKGGINGRNSKKQIQKKKGIYYKKVVGLSTQGGIVIKEKAIGVSKKGIKDMFGKDPLGEHSELYNLQIKKIVALKESSPPQKINFDIIMDVNNELQRIHAHNGFHYKKNCTTGYST